MQNVIKIIIKIVHCLPIDEQDLSQVCFSANAFALMYKAFNRALHVIQCLNRAYFGNV